MRNKAHPEGCIAESVLAKEAMHFCSTFLDGFHCLIGFHGIMIMRSHLDALLDMY
jgi:hypothetical protein